MNKLCLEKVIVIANSCIIRTNFIGKSLTRNKKSLTDPSEIRKNIGEYENSYEKSLYLDDNSKLICNSQPMLNLSLI